MREQLEKLLALQAIDLRLRHLEKDLEELPVERREAEKALEADKTELAAVEKEMEKTILARKAHEGELDKNTDLIQKSNQKLSVVKTNKEYAALESEIATLRQSNSGIEEKVLAEMERLEELEKRKSAVRKSVEEKEAGLAETSARVEKEIAELGDAVEKVRAERNQATVGIERQLLSRYEKIRSGKDGMALAKIDRNACEVCYRSIPPQRIIEVKKLDRIIACEGCGRILIWRD